MAETYGDKNGYNARKRRKSDAGYIHGGGSVAWRRGRGAVQRKATPVTYSAAGAWRGAAHIVRFGQKMFRKCTCSDFQKKIFPGSVWYWRLDFSDKT